MNRRILRVAVICGAFMGMARAQKNGIPTDAQNVMDHFSKAALRAHMEFLADDLLEGRGTGTRGQELAAKYVATQFEATGLEPAGEKGTYFQNVPFLEITVDPKASEFSIKKDGKLTELKWGTDFVCRGSELGTNEDVEAPVVFVGYGVVAKGQGYDDYAGVDVKGKIVAMVFGAPPSFPSEERAHFASGREKAREAAARGAVGIITIRTPETEGLLPWSRSVIGAELPAFRWLDPQGVPNDSFKEIRAAATISQEEAQKFFDGAAKSWDEVVKNAGDGKPQSFDLKFTARIHAVSKHRKVSSPNVAGVLRGSDATLKNEYVVYTAHTDHLGIGRAVNGDAIYNGAVDDASGVSALIEMAKAFASLPKPPARSVLFLAATAEEKGLLGADYFAHFPTVPIRSIVADVNMDGASVFYTFKDVVPLGAEHNSLGDVVARDAAKLSLQVSPDPMPEQVSFIRADHYPFVRQGVPAITLGEGLQAKDPNVDGRKFVEEWIATRYHAPNDDMNQPLNFDATIQYMQLGFLVGYDLAQDRQRPVWKSGDFFGELFGQAK
jgi:Zn-dependent M28 family amino/carboxypeptidase